MGSLVRLLFCLNLTSIKEAIFHTVDTVHGTFTEACKHQSCKQSSKSIFAHSIICFNAALNYCFPLPLLSNLAFFQPTLYHSVSSSKNSSVFSS